MTGFKAGWRFLQIFAWVLIPEISASGQSKYKSIPLPVQLRDINQEFSGMAQLDKRVYVLPQYGNAKETGLDGAFALYSFSADSVSRVIEGKDTTLTGFNTYRVRNLEKLPQFIKKTYQGFETLTFLGTTVYMAIETVDTAANCYLVKGVIDTLQKQISIDYKNYLALPRPVYVSNAGYESVAWLPGINKLIAFYEFNASSDGSTAYLIDTSLTIKPEPVKTPLLYFRNTDAVAAANGGIYAINYYWDGDYDKYLDNGIVKDVANGIKRDVPTLRSDLADDPEYLKSHTFARIVYLRDYRKKKWKQVAVFDGFIKNWEGLTLFKNGALVITDANRSAKQVTTMAYIEFYPSQTPPKTKNLLIF